MASPCLFCRIADGEIPTEFVYADDDIVAFRDIDPKAPTHLLAITRQHFANIYEVESDRLRGHLLGTAARLGQEHGPEGFRLVANTGPNGGQTVDHVHIHILAGRPMTWPPG
jgi:histidine triad (HIT) family protein